MPFSFFVQLCVLCALRGKISSPQRHKEHKDSQRKTSNLCPFTVQGALFGRHSGSCILTPHSKRLASEGQPVTFPGLCHGLYELTQTVYHPQRKRKVMRRISIFVFSGAEYDVIGNICLNRNLICTPKTRSHS